MALNRNREYLRQSILSYEEHELLYSLRAKIDHHWFTDALGALEDCLQNGDASTFQSGVIFCGSFSEDLPPRFLLCEDCGRGILRAAHIWLQYWSVEWAMSLGCPCQNKYPEEAADWMLERGAPNTNVEGLVWLAIAESQKEVEGE